MREIDRPGLDVHVLRLGGMDLTVLSFPLPDDSRLAPLTATEREVALLALKGLSSEEIGVQRSTSARTVANQLSSIFRKLGVGGRGELAAFIVDPR